MAKDYTSTLNLPTTEFPMRANLPQREPDTLKYWESIDLYNAMLEKNKDKTPFILHDGPPFSNGYIHMGHALNKTLKDFIVRSQAMMGHYTPYVPGWDNHGLPIERAIENSKKKLNKEMSVPEFRKACEDFAEDFIQKQMTGFKRLGVVGDWKAPYRTMDRHFEGQEVKIFGRMFDKGYIYKGLKPVTWCPFCATAVAEADIQANVEEVVNEPLISTELKGSAVKKEAAGIHGSTVWTLKNGLKVIVLPTEYKKDQVIFTLEKDGGKNNIPVEDLPSFEDNIWQLYLANTGVSKFSGTALPKMLAGKRVAVNPYLSGYEHGVRGQSAPKDLETAFQLAYLYYADPRFDENEFKAGIQQIEAIFPNIKNTPDYKYGVEVDKVLYGNNPRVVSLDDETLAKADLKTIEKNYRRLFGGVNGATLTIVGNVDLQTLKPLVEKYFGSLPKGKKGAINKKDIISFAKGNVVKTLELEMETPKSSVLQFYSAYMPVTTKTNVTLSVAKYILNMIYTKTIREQEGGTYGVGVAMAGHRSPQERALIQVQFDTNPEQSAQLCESARKQLYAFAENGPTAEEMTIAIENLKKNIPESRISNNYWMSVLSTWDEHGIDYDSEYEAAVGSVSAEDVKALLKSILEQNNFIELKSMPVGK